jgi:hypothetical protein
MIRLAVILALAGLLVTSLAPPACADLSEKLGPLSGDNAKGYLGPLPKALSSTFNSGVFQSGHVGNGILLGIHVMAVEFKDADRTFMPTDPPGFTSTSPTPVPTFVGDTASVNVQGQGGLVAPYPGGFDISQFTIAAPELTIGAVAGTRAVIRWFNAKVGDSDYGKVDLLGIGLQHEVSRYFKELPVDVAVGGFYQKLKIGDGLLDTKAMHFDVTASKRFGHVFQIEPYVSLGYDTFKMSLAYKSTSNPGENISVDFDKLSNKHIAVGAQLQVVFLKLHAEYVSAANNGAALGVSLGH